MSGDIYEDDNGPAFPSDNKYRQFCTGLTKREWFAGMALQGMMSCALDTKHSQKANAMVCFEMADAMLKESEKGK